MIYTNRTLAFEFHQMAGIKTYIIQTPRYIPFHAKFQTVTEKS